MKFLLFSMVIALVASSALGRRDGGRSLFRRRNVNIDMNRVMYAAGGSVQCDLCEMVVGDIQSLMSGQQDEIENLLDSLCNVLPTEYRSNCTNLIDTYLPLLFTLINDMTPAEVCELLTLCAAETEMPELTGRESLTSVFNHYLARVARVSALKKRRVQYMRSLVGEDYLCEACEDTFGYVHDFVACDQTWDQIVQLIEPLCELCPSQHRSQCLEFFQQLPGDIDEFADEYLNPQTDCQVLGFCQADQQEETRTTTVAPEVPEQEPEVPVEIPVEVRSHRVQVDVEDLFRDVNRYSKKQFRNFPKSKAEVARRFGNANLGRMRKPRAINVYVAGETENQISYDTFGTEERHYETVPAQKKCEVCRYFSSAAEGVIQSNEADITNGLRTVFEDICNAIPEQFKDECDTKIKDALPETIYQTLLEMMNPDYLCVEIIGICQ